MGPICIPSCKMNWTLEQLNFPIPPFILPTWNPRNENMIALVHQSTILIRSIPFDIVFTYLPYYMTIQRLMTTVLSFYKKISCLLTNLRKEKKSFEIPSTQSILLVERNFWSSTLHVYPTHYFDSNWLPNGSLNK